MQAFVPRPHDMHKTTLTLIELLHFTCTQSLALVEDATQIRTEKTPQRVDFSLWNFSI